MKPFLHALHLAYLQFAVEAGRVGRGSHCTKEDSATKCKGKAGSELGKSLCLPRRKLKPAKRPCYVANKLPGTLNLSCAKVALVVS